MASTLLPCLVLWSLPLALSVFSGAPGKYHDLSKWTLNVPSKQSSQYASTALQSYSSPYFYTNATDGSITMWSPANGTVLLNGDGPRTFLEENLEIGFQGFHQFNATIAVLGLPPSGQVTIAQLGGDSVGGNLLSNLFHVQSNPNCLQVASLLYNNGTLFSYFRDSACNPMYAALGNYSLGENISLSFTSVNQQIYAITNKGSAGPYAYSWWDLSFQSHFAVGVYNHGSSNSSNSSGGLVKLFQLATSHVNTWGPATWTRTFGGPGKNIVSATSATTTSQATTSTMPKTAAVATAAKAVTTALTTTLLASTAQASTAPKTTAAQPATTMAKAATTVLATTLATTTAKAFVTVPATTLAAKATTHTTAQAAGQVGASGKRALLSKQDQFLV